MPGLNLKSKRNFMSNAEKLKALKLTIDKIDKDFGKVA